MGNIHCCSCIIFFLFLLKLQPIYNLEVSNSSKNGVFFLLPLPTCLVICLFIVLQFFTSSATYSLKTLDNPEENSTSKRRKTFTEDLVGDCINDVESKDSSIHSRGTTSTSNFLANMTWILLGFFPVTNYSIIYV